VRLASRKDGFEPVPPAGMPYILRHESLAALRATQSGLNLSGVFDSFIIVNCSECDSLLVSCLRRQSSRVGSDMVFVCMADLKTHDRTRHGPER
jgi:hypothetical protein